MSLRRVFLFLPGVLALICIVAPPAVASSHREAPEISKDPTADNTDVYAFVSPDKPGTVTLIANYLPLEEPAGGPNFYNFDETVRYGIHVDNDGDGRSDITYQFRFRTVILNKETFLYNTGPITSLDDPDYNYRQFYSVDRIVDGESDRLCSNVPVPPSNIGPRSTPNYEALAADAVKELHNGISLFAGQRDDPFFVDTGSIFDLAGLRPFNSAHLIPLEDDSGVDGLGGFNVHTIALQVPIEQLTKNGKKPSGPADPTAVIGVYASAQRGKTRAFKGGRFVNVGDEFVQVSRLANPLINEVFIPLEDKDRWNTRRPASEEKFVEYYLNPEMAALVNLLYPSLPDAPETGRTDLVTVFLTGIPGVNFTGDNQAELLRLNLGIAPTADVGEGDRLAVLAGDLGGFPNGRRLEDDVTDIEIRAAACGYGDFVEGLLGLCNLSPNNTLGDGVDENDRDFLDSFPYVATPHQGYEHEHHLTGP